MGGVSKPKKKWDAHQVFDELPNPSRRYVIVGGGNAAGYAARTFVEHGMADGRLCIVSKEVSAQSGSEFRNTNFCYYVD